MLANTGVNEWADEDNTRRDEAGELLKEIITHSLRY